jgi:hypothetical protein
MADIEEQLDIHIDMAALAAALGQTPQAVAALADFIRDQMLIDSRRTGNLYGPTAAQKKTPLASKPQVPGTQRVW